jgi:hypothetical protein
VDRRKHPRVRPAEAISVTILSDESVCVQATVVDHSERGLGLQLTAPLIPGTPVKIERGDQLLLAEVTHCVRHEGSFRAGLVVKHSLSGLAELHRLNRALDEASPTPPVPSIMER